MSLMGTRCSREGKFQKYLMLFHLCGQLPQCASGLPSSVNSGFSKHTVMCTWKNPRAEARRGVCYLDQLADLFLAFAVFAKQDFQISAIERAFCTDVNFVQCFGCRSGFQIGNRFFEW